MDAVQSRNQGESLKANYCMAKNGPTQMLWCEQSWITYRTFHYWFKHFKIERPSQVGKLFIRLKADVPENNSGIELIFGDNHRLVFHRLLSVDFIKALIS